MTFVTTDDMRDVSLREAAKLLHRSQATLKAQWDQIPTAIHEGHRYYVSIDGLKRWQQMRRAS